MKKLALALVCLVSVAFFASCTDPVENPEPSIAILAGEGYVTDGAIVNLNETVNFGFILASNLETNKELKSLVITIDDAEFDNVELTGTSYTYTSELVYSMEEREIIGESVIKAIVTDVEGETATATITLSINQEDNLEVADFQWVRHGGVVATGLAEYGLIWESNVKDIFAVIKPMEGVTLYQFEPAQWAQINTNSEKTAAFAAAAEGVSIADFRGVSCLANHDYDYVIGTVMENGETHLMHITRGEVSTFKGTEVIIYGQAK